MATQGQVPASARFGAFEICFDPPELRKFGYRLKLSGQALQVLLLLAEEPGRIVTREELQRKLWPNAGFGDFEHGLNAAVNRLRETLGDSANEPKYIETIPRRGYRFIAAFEPEASPMEGPSLVEARNSVPIEAVPPRWRRSIAAPVAGVLLLATLLTTYFWPGTAPKILAIVPITHDGFQKGDPQTDGERLYFGEARGAHRWALFQVSSEGGETSPVGPYFGVDPFQISRNRSELLAGIDWDGRHKMEPEITVLPLPSGPPQRLGIFSHWAAAWSRDESRVIYARGNGTIYAAGRDGANPQKLAEVDGLVSYLRFSPDGDRIRFTLQDTAQTKSALWEMRADGTHLHPLFRSPSSPTYDCCGSWTPDGKYYVFQRIQFDGLFQKNLWAMRESNLLPGRRSPDAYPLTMGPLHWSYPIVSPDGGTVFAVGSQPRGELVRHDPRSQQFVPFLAGVSASELDFSRDGQWVTYISMPNRLLWRSHIDGSERLRLTDTSVESALPRWSPDGKRIAFMMRQPGQRWKINIISAQGGAPQQVLTEELNEVDPTWAPDGNSMAFGRLESSSGAEQPAIFILDLKTRKVTEIAGSQGLFSPRWSPDGRYIAADRADYSRMVLFDFHTNTWSEWITPAGTFPVWASDSKSIYFDTAWTSEPYYCRARVGETTPERLFSLDSIPLFWGQWGTWSGLAPDGSGLFLRDASAQEIYALKMQWR
jgi:Tol biopolymer transport system component/DNA-binding winged helix-turn-helix (wHTH) protein